MSIEKTCYLQARVCASRCGWTGARDRNSRRITPPRLICPSCGGETETVVGRYSFIDHKKWLGLVRWREYLDFEEK